MTVDVDGHTVIRSNGEGLSGSDSSSLCSGYYRDDDAPRAHGFLVSDPGWKVSFAVADRHARPTGTFGLARDGEPYRVSLTQCANSDGCGLFASYTYDHVVGSITITNSTDRLVGGGSFDAACKSDLLSSCGADGKVHAAITFDLDASDCD